MAEAQGLMLQDVPGMKFILDGRRIATSKAEQWTVDENGFTFLTGQDTVASVEAFRSTPSECGSEIPATRFFQFTDMNHDSDCDSACPISSYYKEVAGMCKKVLPTAEAAVVTYHVLRKSDLRFDSGKYDVAPKLQESPLHQMAAKMVSSLGYIEFMAQSDLEQLSRNLDGDRRAQENLFLELGRGSLFGKLPESQHDEVVALLFDAHYDYVTKLRGAIEEALHKRKEPESQDSTSFQPPALGGGHTDCAAESCLDQFKPMLPLLSENGFGKPPPGKQRRVVFLKFWRNIADTAIVNHHLAMLDKSSLQDSDIHEAEINFKGYAIKQNRLNATVDADKLRWVYFPDMLRNEVICFQQGKFTMHAEDSEISFPPWRQDHATFHGAIEDPTAPPGAAPRQSIECAAFVVLPEEPETSSKL